MEKKVVQCFFASLKLARVVTFILYAPAGVVRPSVDAFPYWNSEFVCCPSADVFSIWSVPSLDRFREFLECCVR